MVTVVSQKFEAPDGSVQVSLTGVDVRPKVGPAGTILQSMESPSGSNELSLISAAVAVPVQTPPVDDVKSCLKGLHFATGGWLGDTMMFEGADAMPFAMTWSVIGPFSRLVGESNCVVTTVALPTASTPIWLWS